MGTVALRQPERSPEREALAAAITRHTAAQDRLAKVTAASEQHFVWPAQEKVEQAEQELAQARKREPERLVSQLLGDHGAAEPTVEQCECKIACNNDPLRGVFRVQFRPPVSCCVSVLPFGLDRPGRAGGDDWRGQDRRDTAGLF